MPLSACRSARIDFKALGCRNTIAMKKTQKKKYEKPTVRKIKLDAKTAVLGFCKNSGFLGPSGPGCGQPGPGCNSAGS